jgi:tetratricopeptide (TPR) repeat protein
MNEQRWQRIEELFAEASALPAADRLAFLERACPGDAPLIEEVQSLLAFDTMGAAVPIAEAIGKVAASFDDPVPESGFAGPYRLLREIGQGGMGTVYLGVREDDQYHREVAVKLVRRGMDSDEILARFRTERQILARLEHPRIARLYDGGSTVDHRPFIVMEYVAGKPIHAYCREHGLSIPQRLDLFRKVCEAVDYAHRNLIVHRDLKPSNILVDGAGEPKLLDFGVAKVLEANSDPQQTMVQTGMRLLTPEYASPEQVRGEPVTTATDIYALGVILYELLTGEKAHQFTTGLSQTEMERVICEQEGPRVTIGNDLDNIVRKAMRKEPQRRYSSVAHLSDDIRRFLENRPVEARPDSAGYRLGKFVRRNRALVTAAALLVVTLLGGVAATVWQARIARANARRAEQRFAQVRSLANTMLFEVDRGLANLAGATATRELLVRTALTYLDSLASAATGDIALQTELASAYERIGDIQGSPVESNLGKRTEATKSYRKALTIREQVLAAQPQDPDAMRALALSLRRYAAVSGNAEDVAALQRAVDLTRQVYALRPADRDAQSLIFTMLSLLGDEYRGRGNVPEQLRVIEQAREAYEEWVPHASEDQADALGAPLFLRIGGAMQDAGRLEEAAQWLQKAVHRYERIAQRNPANARNQSNLMLAYDKLGSILGDPSDANLGRTAEAIAVYRKGVALGDKLLAADARDRRVRAIQSYIWSGLGSTTRLLAPVESLSWFDKAIAMLRESVATDSGNIAVKIDLASQLLHRATSFEQLRRWPAAERDLREALRLYAAAAAARKNALNLRQNAIPAYAQLAPVLEQMGNRKGAAEALREGLALAEPIALSHYSPSRMSDVSQLHRNAGEFASRGGDRTRACEHLEKAEQYLAELERRSYALTITRRQRQSLEPLLRGCPSSGGAQ